MSKEKEIQPVEETQDEVKVEEVKEAKPETIVWDEADLCVKCNQCGTVTKINTIKKGVQFIMSTTNDSKIELFCPACESRMSLFYENGRMLPKEDKEEKISAEKVDEIVAKEEKKAVDQYLKEKDEGTDDSNAVKLDKVEEDEPQKKDSE